MTNKIDQQLIEGQEVNNVDRQNQTNQDVGNSNSPKLPNVLRNKNFLLLFLGTLVSNVGNTFYSFVVSFYILAITNNNAIIQGAFLATCGVVFLLFSTVGGVLADRYNKAKIIYICDFIKGGIIIISAVVIYFCIANDMVILQIVVLFIMGIVSNIIGAIFSPATSSLTPYIVKPMQLQQANSYFSVLNSLQGIVGILIAGIIYSILPIMWLFVLIGILYVLSGISEIFIRYDFVKKEGTITIKNVFADFVQGIRYLKPEKALVGLIMGILFVNFFLTPYMSNGAPYFIKTYLNGEYLLSSVVKPEMWQSIWSVCVGAGSLIMGLIVSHKAQKAKYGKSIKLWMLLMAVAMTIAPISFYIFVYTKLSVSAYLIITSCLLFFFGLSVVNINIPVATIIQSRVDKDMLAKVSSVLNIGSMGLTPIASMLGGVIIGLLGLGAVLIFCSVGFLFTAILISSNKSINSL
ncbi:MAG: MFS transporter [Clostridia bacterium]